MKIAYLCFDDGIPVGGNKGASIHLKNITQALANEGNRVLVIAVSGVSPKDDENLCFKILSYNRYYKLFTQELKDSEEYSCIHKDLKVITKILDYQAEALHLLDQFRPDFLLERYTLFCMNGINLSRILDIPLALEINAPLALEAAQYRSLYLQRTAHKIEETVFSLADIRLPVSKELSNYVTNRTGSTENTITLSNGADINSFNPYISADKIRNLYHIELNTVVIGYVGGFKLWHDLPAVLQAFAQIIQLGLNVHLLLVGDGPSLESCKYWINDHRISEKVTSTGFISPEEVPDYVAAMDITITPFTKLDLFYFSPLKLFEYMAAGKCCVASSHGQIKDIIKHQENGWLYSPGDQEDLVKVLVQLIKHPDLRLRTGQLAYEYVKKYHTWKKNAQVIQNVFQQYRGIKA